MMGNEGADPKTAMSLVGKVEMQGKVCEIKSATPREGSRGRRSDDTNHVSIFAKTSTAAAGNPTAVPHSPPAVVLGAPPTMMMGAPVYGYPPAAAIGYPSSMMSSLPPAMYYPPPPYAASPVSV